MPYVKGNKIAVTVFMDPGLFRKIEDNRNVELSSSAWCAQLLEQAIGYQK